MSELFCCPECKAPCQRETVDIGVGSLHGPWQCPNCGWNEDDLFAYPIIEEEGGMADLILRNLWVENFKAFSGEHTFKLDQRPGLYYVTGKNKLEPELGANGVGKTTIWDALTWCLWNKTGRDNRPGSAITPWINGKHGSVVTLLFERQGRTQQIQRMRSPNHLYWCEHDEPFKEIPQERVADIIGMSEEMFRRTLVLGQFGDLFLDLGPEQQSKMFTEALSLDVWVKAVEIANKFVRKYEDEVDALILDEETNKRLIEEFTISMKEAATRSEKFEQEKHKTLDLAEAILESRKKDLREHRKNKVERPALPKPSEKQAKIEKEIREKRENLAVLNTDLRHCRDLTIKITTRIEDLVKNRSRKCPTCGQAVSKEEHLRQCEEAKREAEAQAEVYDNITSELGVITERLKTQQEALAREDKAFEAAKKGYDKAIASWRTWDNEDVRLDSAVKSAEDQAQGVRDRVNDAAAEHARLKARRKEAREDLQRVQADLVDLQKQLEHAKFWVDGFKEIRLGIIDDALVELEMATSRHAMMLGLDDWGVKFETERETKSGTVSHSFTVFLYPPGSDEPVKWESYSGGESQRWQLAVAFALSEVLLARAGVSPNVEVLDEPTKGLSVEGVDDLLSHLHDRAVDLRRAIYFVDHHSLDKGAFDGTLMVEKTKKGSEARWL